MKEWVLDIVNKFKSLNKEKAACVLGPAIGYLIASLPLPSLFNLAIVAVVTIAALAAAVQLKGK